MATRILPVPYFTQPTDNTCQSTVLKMFALYVERAITRGDGDAAALDPKQIYKTINSDPKRPSQFENAHANMRWWLE